MIKWHRNDLKNRMYCPMEEGKKIAMPRYYKNKIYSDAERHRIGKHYEKLQLGKEALMTEEEFIQEELNLLYKVKLSNIDDRLNKVL